MPNFVLMIKIEAEGVESLVPQVGRLWHVQLECGSCGSAMSKVTTLCATDEKVEVPGGRGHATLVAKCKECDRSHSIDVLDGAETAIPATGEWAPSLLLECRGFVPTAFQPNEGWSVTCPSGHTFSEVDLTDGEFADYDPEADEPVHLSAFEAKFEVDNKKSKTGKRRK